MSKFVICKFVSFNNVWVKRENWRAENFSITLRDSYDFVIPTALLYHLKQNASLVTCTLNYGVNIKTIKLKL